MMIIIIIIILILKDQLSNIYLLSVIKPLRMAAFTAFHLSSLSLFNNQN